MSRNEDGVDAVVLTRSSHNWEGEAPVEPNASDCVIIHAAQQELCPPNSTHSMVVKPPHGPLISHTMYDPKHGAEPFEIEKFSMRAAKESVPARSNCFGVYQFESGAGEVAVDEASHAISAPGLLFVVPYQRLKFTPHAALQGNLIRFHANFLCIETFHAEAGCAGVLFRDPYGLPFLPLTEEQSRRARELCDSITAEALLQAIAYTDVTLAYLKILLIEATRWKSADPLDDDARAIIYRHPVLQQLISLVEEHYADWHTPAKYAKALHLTPKTLGRLVREHLGTTPTELVRARILSHAKWQLLHTLRPVKEIAAEVGFQDVFYFSRLFKKGTGMSPLHFREFETRIRNGSNLSMPSVPSSIPDE